MGVVFQFFQLLPTLTALENIMLPMDFCAQSQDTKTQTALGRALEEHEKEQSANSKRDITWNKKTVSVPNSIF